MPNKQAAIAEALRRGLITPQQAQAKGYGGVANAASTGKLAPGGPVASDIKTDQERLDKLREAAQLHRWVADNADQFIDINTKQGTGQMLGVGTPLTGTFGDLVANFDPELATLKGITAKVGRKLRTPGEGATSDFEAKMNLTAFPNISAPGPSNVALAKQWRQEAEYRSEMADFYDAWFAKNGTLLGAESAFQKARDAKKPRGGNSAAPAPKSSGDGWRVVGEE